MRIILALIAFTAGFAVRPAVGEDKTPGSTPPATLHSTATALAASSDEVVARVGSREIRRKELSLALEGVKLQIARSGRPFPDEQVPVLEHRIVDDMVDRELVLQEGLVHPPTGLDAKVQLGLDHVRSQLGGEDGLSNALKEAGLTFSEYARRARENAIIQETMRAVLEREVQIAPEEIKAYYETNRARLKWPESVRLSHILIRVTPEAPEDIKKAKRVQIEAARSLITGGDKFTDVARMVSEDPASATHGGDIGYFTRGQMAPELEEAAFSLKTNELSGVITTQYGYQLLLVTDRKQARQALLEEVKDDIEKDLRYRKGAQVTQQHIKELRDKTKIEVLLTPLPPAVNPPDLPATPGAPVAPATKP